MGGWEAQAEKRRAEALGKQRCPLPALLLEPHKFAYRNAELHEHSRAVWCDFLNRF